MTAVELYTEGVGSETLKVDCEGLLKNPIRKLQTYSNERKKQFILLFFCVSFGV